MGTAEYGLCRRLTGRVVLSLADVVGVGKAADAESAAGLCPRRNEGARCDWARRQVVSGEGGIVVVVQAVV